MQIQSLSGTDKSHGDVSAQSWFKNRKLEDLDHDDRVMDNESLVYFLWCASGACLTAKEGQFAQF